MKTHRQLRISKRVSSETGTSFGSENASVQLYGDKLEAVMKILDSLPPAERKTLLVDAVKRLQAVV